MRAFPAFAICLALGACGHPRSPVAPGDVVWDYEARETAGTVLEIVATFHGGDESPLHVDDDAEPFVDEISIVDGASTRSFDRASPGWAQACGEPCRVRYRVRLGDAAAALHDVDVAITAGGAVVAPPSAWLLRPKVVPEGARYRLRVTPAPGSRFVTGVHAASGGKGYEAPIASLEEASFSAFGPLRVLAGAARGVDVAIAPELAPSDDVVGRWARTSAEAIEAYLGRGAPGGVVVFVVPGTGEVNRGKTFLGGGASVLVRLAERVTPADLAADWVLAHELVHAGFPAMSPEYGWFAEGLATYVEPIARARAGLVTPEKLWAELAEGLPRGAPKPGDGGLDGTRDIDRVYWGGAMYFLLAELTIRDRTYGARSLEDAVRGMVTSGATGEASLDGLLDAGDRATGTHVLRELYERFGRAAGTEDTGMLLAKLGVVRAGKTVRLDDKAALASVRRAITRPSAR